MGVVKACMLYTCAFHTQMMWHIIAASSYQESDSENKCLTCLTINRERLTFAMLMCHKMGIVIVRHV